MMNYDILICHRKNSMDLVQLRIICVDMGIDKITLEILV